MIRLAIPAHTAGDVFAKCISGKIEPQRKARLEGLQAAIEVGDVTYHGLAQSAQLFKMPDEILPEGVDLTEVAGVYTQRFVPEKSLGRDIYEDLILAPDNRTCPLCGIGFVESLDHYLPKHFWKFIVSPKNLVPSCLHCNKVKLEHSPASFGDQTIHPYYDDFQSHTWLCATVIEKVPPSVTYEVVNLEHWDDQNMMRARTHFTKHGLAALFTSNAGNELSENKKRFQDLYQKCGPKGVRDHLVSELKYLPLKNDWKTALYKALSESDWFCHEDCLLI
ncbi:MAG: hypothetical protein WBD16_16390 [Pyrinomonadaceae bacterium]